MSDLEQDEHPILKAPPKQVGRNAKLTEEEKEAKKVAILEKHKKKLAELKKPKETPPPKDTGVSAVRETLPEPAPPKAIPSKVDKEPEPEPESESESEEEEVKPKPKPKPKQKKEKPKPKPKPKKKKIVYETDSSDSDSSESDEEVIVKKPKAPPQKVQVPEIRKCKFF